MIAIVIAWRARRPVMKDKTRKTNKKALESVGKLRRLKRDLQTFLSDVENGVLMDEPLLTGGEDEEFTSLVRLRKTLKEV
jgi:hypothetical protein